MSRARRGCGRRPQHHPTVGYGHPPRGAIASRQASPAIRAAARRAPRPGHPSSRPIG